MRCVLENLSGNQTSAWTRVAVPASFTWPLWKPGDPSNPESQATGPLVFKADTGARFAAVPGELLGHHTRIFRVLTPFEGGQRWEGALETGDHVEHRPFHLHPWCSEIEDLFVWPMIKIGGVIHEVDSWGSVEMESDSPAHQTWSAKARVGDSGMVFRLWAEFRAGDPVVDLKALVIWSDRTNPAPDLAVEGIALRGGEPIAVDFRGRSGHSDPFRVGEKWHTVLSGPVGMIDGSAVVAFGRMLCLPADLTTIQEGEPWLDALIAGFEAPTVGCATEWPDGEWMAHGNLPKWLGSGPLGRDGRRGRFKALTEAPGKAYERRPLGTGPHAGTTGDQEDFGSSKGTWAVVAQDPAWIHEAAYSVQGEFFRGYMHYEEGTGPVLAENHPLWVTWSGYIDARFGTDRLGKRPPGYFERRSTGWGTYDDQHRSQNNVAAYYALTGDPSIRTVVEHQLEADRAAFTGRMGAPRAVGRLLLNWANWARLLNEPYQTTCIDLILERFDNVLNHWEGRHHSGPIRILDYMTDVRLNVLDPGGAPVPAWSAWEHGLCCSGLYAASKVLAGVNRQALLDFLAPVARTITDFATFTDVGGPTQRQWCANVHYPVPASIRPPGQAAGLGDTVARGDSLPSEHYSRTSTYLNSGDYGGVHTWTVLAILIDWELSGNVTARNILRDLGPTTRLTDQRTAEWWACIDTAGLLIEP